MRKMLQVLRARNKILQIPIKHHWNSLVCPWSVTGLSLVCPWSLPGLSLVSFHQSPCLSGHCLYVSDISKHFLYLIWFIWHFDSLNGQFHLSTHSVFTSSPIYWLPYYTETTSASLRAAAFSRHWRRLVIPWLILFKFVFLFVSQSTPL